MVKDFQDTIRSYHFLHKDYLGSILAISNDEGALIEERHYDARGNLTHGRMGILYRGYTSHEHIPSVGFVHMNGRLYDPNLRRFLNANANIQGEFNSLNYNKYAYVLCNPLMYNDPTGEFFFAALGLAAILKAIFIGAAVGLASYTLSLAVTGNLKSWNLGGTLMATFFGVVSGAITFGIESSSMQPHSLLAMLCYRQVHMASLREYWALFRGTTSSVRWLQVLLALGLPDGED